MAVQRFSAARGKVLEGSLRPKGKSTRDQWLGKGRGMRRNAGGGWILSAPAERRHVLPESFAAVSTLSLGGREEAVCAFILFNRGCKGDGRTRGWAWCEISISSGCKGHGLPWRVRRNPWVSTGLREFGGRAEPVEGAASCVGGVNPVSEATDCFRGGSRRRICLSKKDDQGAFPPGRSSICGKLLRPLAAAGGWESHGNRLQDGAQGEIEGESPAGAGSTGWPPWSGRDRSARESTPSRRPAASGGSAGLRFSGDGKPGSRAPRPAFKPRRIPGPPRLSSFDPRLRRLPHR